MSSDGLQAVPDLITAHDHVDPVVVGTVIVLPLLKAGNISGGQKRLLACDSTKRRGYWTDNTEWNCRGGP